MENKEKVRVIARSNVPDIVPGSKIIVVEYPFHLCNGKNATLLASQQFKLTDVEGKTQVINLYTCPICNNKFITNRNYRNLKRRYTNYSFELELATSTKELYKIAKQRGKYDTVELIEKGTIIYRGRPSHKCIYKNYQYVDFRGFLGEKKSRGSAYNLKKCNKCGKIFIRNDTYERSAYRYKKYHFVSLKEEARKKQIIEKQKAQPVIERNRYISPKDFLTRVNIFRCTNENHELIDITGGIRILDKTDHLAIVEFPAAYCKDCDKYYILESEYKKLKSKGIIVCKVVEREFWTNSTKNNPYNLNEESLLYILGYNVSAQEGLSNSQRWAILEIVVDEKILSKMEICSHLDYLINRSKSRSNMASAVSKWKLDKDHISKYGHSAKKVEAKTIRRNIYK